MSKETLNGMLYRVQNLEPGQSVKGVSGQLPFFSAADAINGRYICNRVTVATSQIEVDEAKGTGEDFKRVFDTYQRVSISSTKPNNEEAIPAELKSWQLLDGLICCTLNTAGYVGFVADDAYEDYDFIVNLRVTPGQESFNDDDRVGIILGHYKDSNGVVHNLSYYYNREGGTNRCLIYNYVGANALTLNAKGDASDRGPHALNAAAGCRVKVTRKGSILSISSTLGYQTIAERDNAPYHPPYEVTYDLNSSAQGRKFLGPQRYGYMAHSQDAATYEVISKPGGSVPVYDISTNKLWVKESGVWVIKPNAEVFTKGLFYNDIDNKKFYHFNGTTLQELR